MEEFLLQVAHGAVAVLVALVLWFLLSDNSIMQTVKDLIPVTLPWQKGA